ncbi:MAG: bacteriophage abortive infection AbiH family protein [Clostridia bacterium]|nr:bacteriophage abortive infection AbiH family protein [Clostridia bacterium]
MRNRLFIIGNGFDLAHELPTSYPDHFKKIAESNESITYFWDIYQTETPNIWSDFEYCLGHPDFNSLEEIFEGYAPDYLSDHESDRDAIITQVDISGNLYKSLSQFAENAETDLHKKMPLEKYSNCFCDNDVFVSFNYTHTLERLYGIKETNVLHIHGEVGKSNLIMGYPKGEYKPEKYIYDVRQKGRGPYRECDIRDHVKQMEAEEIFDYYTAKAYKDLIDKTESFNKDYQEHAFASFLNHRIINEIIILGHSCKIDFDYFQYLTRTFPGAKWVFNPHAEDDLNNITELIKRIGLREHNYMINPVEESLS